MNTIIDLVKQRPYLTSSLVFIGLGLLLLRKLHYRFVVHPDIQGRSNKTNSFQCQHPRNRGMDSQDIQIMTPDKLVLRGWYVKHKEAQHLIIYYHQNAGNIGMRLYFIQYLQRYVQANVLIVAYRGFSDSDGVGKPNQKNIVDDSISIFQKGVQLAQRDKLPLFVLGKSLGGFSAMSTLSQPSLANKAKGLILQNTLTCLYDVASHLFPKVLAPLLWITTVNSYNSAKNMPKIKIPILFVKGARDALIPKTQMDRLQKIYSDLKGQHFEYVVENGTHNDTWQVGGLDYFNTIKQFLKHCSRL